MSEEGLSVRPAVPSDAYPLWLWANDADTRAASHGRPVIEWSAHVKWMQSQLSSKDAVVLIAETRDGRPVGSTRFDTSDGWQVARLSYVVAPEARRQRLSRSMLDLSTVWIRARRKAACIIADVMAGNQRSLNVFRALGWREVDAPEDGLRRFQS